MSNHDIKFFRSHVADGQIHMMHLQQRDRALHRHAFFELVYILKGSATHWVGQESTPLRAGDYFIIDPGSEHSYRDAEDLELVNCLFLPAYIDRALGECPSLSSLLSNQVLRFGVPVDIRAADRIFHDSDGTVRRLIRQMEWEYAAHHTGCMEMLRCYLTQVLVCAIRASEEAERTRIRHDATTAVVTFLQQHYAQPLSLEQLSRNFGYTPQYLSSLFHKDTGMTIRMFLQRLRVEEACRLAGNRALSLNQIAQAVGYSDLKHFSKVFRRHKGISPREYRASM